MNFAASSWAGRLRGALEGSPVDLDRLTAGFRDAGEGWLDQALDGSREPSTAEYARLAVRARLPLAVLTGAVPQSEPIAFALRAGRLSTADDVVSETALAGKLLERLRLLASWFPEDDLQRRETLATLRRARDGAPYAQDAGRRAAENLRTLLDWPDDAPVVDLTEVVESLGCPVVLRRLPRGVHGMTVHEEADGEWRAVVLVNCMDGWPRQRYTLAHELSHVLYRDQERVIVDREGEVARDNVPEWRAEVFARHLLAPQSAVRAFWAENRGRPEDALARFMLHFGMSRQASIYAIQEVDEGAAGTLEASVAGRTVADLMRSADLEDEWRRLCEGEHEEGASPWMLDMALNAYRAGAVSVDVVAQVLNQDSTVTAQQLSELGWSGKARLST